MIVVYLWPALVLCVAISLDRIQGAAAHQRALIWSVRRNDGGTELTVLIGNPSVWIPEAIHHGNQSNLRLQALVRKNPLESYGAIGADFGLGYYIKYVTNTGFFSRASIEDVHHPTNNVPDFRVAPVTEVADMAVDWVNHQTYWTDPVLKIIGHAPHDISYTWRIFRELGPSTPSAIVVNPSTGHIFVSLHNSGTYSIVKYTFAGDSLLTRTRPYDVTSLMIDYHTDLLYFVEIGTRVYTMALDGSDITDITSRVWKPETLSIAAITVMENLLLIAAREFSRVEIVIKSNYTRMDSFTVSRNEQTLDIAMSAPERQPLPADPSPCPGPCSQLCMRSGSSSLTCACYFGYKLGPDQHQCQPASQAHTDNFLLVSDRYSGAIYQVELDSPGTPAGTRAVLRTPLAVQIAYDPKDRAMFWVSSTKGEVWRAELIGGQPEIIENHPNSMVTGLALDMVQRRVYVTWEREHKLTWVSYDGNSRHDLLHVGLQQRPRGITVNPHTRTVYWAECGFSYNRLMRADMDSGSGVTTLTDLTLVKCVEQLTIDFQNSQLYWAGERTNGAGSVVQSCNLDGSNLRTLATHSTATFWGIALDDRFIYLTDITNSRNVSRLDRNSLWFDSVGYPGHSHLQGLTAYRSSYSMTSRTITSSMPTTTTSSSATASPTKTPPTSITSEPKLLNEAQDMVLVVGLSVGGGVLVVLIVAVTVGVVCRRSRRSRPTPPPVPDRVQTENVQLQPWQLTLPDQKIQTDDAPMNYKTSSVYLQPVVQIQPEYLTMPDQRRHRANTQYPPNHILPPPPENDYERLSGISSTVLEHDN